MGRLTEFVCPKREFARVVVPGSPTPTATVFPEPVNHVVVGAWGGSGWVGFDFTPTSESGLYLPSSTSWQTLDITCGSVSLYTAANGSLNIIGLV